MPTSYEIFSLSCPISRLAPSPKPTPLHLPPQTSSSLVPIHRSPSLHILRIPLALSLGPGGRQWPFHLRKTSKPETETGAANAEDRGSPAETGFWRVDSGRGSRSSVRREEKTGGFVERRRKESPRRRGVVRGGLRNTH